MNSSYKNLIIFEKNKKKYNVIKNVNKVIVQRADLGYFEVLIYTDTVHYMYNLDFYNFCFFGD